MKRSVCGALLCVSVLLTLVACDRNPYGFHDPVFRWSAPYQKTGVIGCAGQKGWDHRDMALPGLCTTFVSDTFYFVYQGLYGEPPIEIDGQYCDLGDTITAKVRTARHLSSAGDYYNCVDIMEIIEFRKGSPAPVE